MDLLGSGDPQISRKSQNPGLSNEELEQAGLAGFREVAQRVQVNSLVYDLALRGFLHPIFKAYV